MITQEEAQLLIDEMDSMQSQLQRLKLKIEDAMMTRMDASGLMASLIMRAVCDVHGLTRTQLLSKCREARFVDARHTVMHLMRHRGGLSCVHAAEFLSCDHTTVIHGASRVTDLLEMEPKFIAKYLECERRFDDLYAEKNREAA